MTVAISWLAACPNLYLESVSDVSGLFPASCILHPGRSLPPVSLLSAVSRLACGYLCLALVAAGPRSTFYLSKLLRHHGDLAFVV